MDYLITFSTVVWAIINVVFCSKLLKLVEDSTLSPYWIISIPFVLLISGGIIKAFLRE